MLATFDLTFDNVGDLIAIESFVDGVTAFDNDETGQLIRQTVYGLGGPTTRDYNYDATGNRVTNDGEAAPIDNRLLTDGTHRYEYDTEGRTTAMIALDGSARTDHRWDHRRRLVEVIRRDGEAADATVTSRVTYDYDPLDRLIASESFITDGLGIEQPGGSTVRVHDGVHMVMLLTDGERSNRYLHGDRVDQLFADEAIDATTGTSQTRWTLTDHLGSVTDLAMIHDDGSITTDHHRRYDGFGVVVDGVGGDATGGSRFGYAGREWEPESGLQYNRARWYAPATSRWLIQDPIGFEAGDVNLYRYLGNQATTLIDPSGLKPPAFQAPTPEQVLLVYDHDDPFQPLTPEQQQQNLADRLSGNPETQRPFACGKDFTNYAKWFETKGEGTIKELSKDNTIENLLAAVKKQYAQNGSKPIILVVADHATPNDAQIDDTYASEVDWRPFRSYLRGISFLGCKFGRNGRGLPQRISNDIDGLVWASTENVQFVAGPMYPPQWLNSEENRWNPVWQIWHDGSLVTPTE